ncbi:hypothetical protein KXD93_22025 [Mucilaginibacter sp. BJC16-A38]|uniref:hypothetical protein n=1 Tax=Mucilaginibacter phenanthrenivorans TaxID=1234842 RepID=UPI002157D172|nr:hypothetical protein [Mucilaginibacter phenanthrenivorans]MCR8560347.1 hypothetical protein [Mucilaginibacter phenanthrenivorans]
MTSNIESNAFCQSGISQRLMDLVCNIGPERSSLLHAENIGTCRFPKGIFSDLVQQIGDQPEAIRSVKYGYQVWKNMSDKDRLIVLQCFLKVFYEYTRDFSPAQKVGLFCRLFVRDFIPVLEEYKSVKFSTLNDNESAED